MGAGALLLIALVGLSTWTGLQAWQAYIAARASAAQAALLEEALFHRDRLDLTDAQQRLNAVRSEARRGRQALQRMPWLGYMPVVGRWRHSAQEAFRAIELAAEGGSIAVSSLAPFERQLLDAPDVDMRLAALTEALASNQDAMAEAGRLLHEAAALMEDARTGGLPSTVLDIEVRGHIDRMASAVALAARVADWLPHLPWLLGADAPRRYLVLYQDAAEVRATGGFLAAYSYLEVDRGHVRFGESHDIYELAGASCPAAAVPREALALAQEAPPTSPFRYFVLGLYRDGLPVQDSNWWPDLARSMELFLCHYRSLGMPPVDGVLLVDTWFLTGLLEHLGPVVVPGYPEPFSAEAIDYLGAMIPQAAYEIVFYAERAHVDGPNRKRVVGDLAQALWERVRLLDFTAAKELGKEAFQLAARGHAYMYFADATLDALVRRDVGSSPAAPADGDFLRIVEASYGAAKSGLFMTRQVTSETVVSGRGAMRRVRIVWENHGPEDGWLNRPGSYVVRLYVPEGSRLVSAQGYVGRPVVYSEDGSTVFAFLLEMPAPGSAMLAVDYEVEVQGAGYTLLVFKQPGIPRVQISMRLAGEACAVDLEGREYRWSASDRQRGCGEGV